MQEQQERESLAQEVVRLRRRVRALEGRHERSPAVGKWRIDEPEVGRNVIATSPDAIMMFEVETKRFEDVNDAALKLYGYTEEEFLGLTHADITAEPEASDQSFDITRQNGWMTIPLRYHKKKDGTVFPVEISASTFTLGGRRMFCGVVRDITERRRREEELCQSRDHFETLFELAPDPSFLIDVKGTLIDGNQAAEKTIGYQRDELIGKNLLQLNLLPPAQIPKAAALLAQHALGRPTGPDEFLLNRKDGRRVPVDIQAFPVELGGKMVVLCMARDITARKAAEEALLNACSELESRDADRAAALEAANATMRALVEGTATATGDDFFPSFARALANAFGSRYVLVCEHLDSPPTRVRTLAFWTGSELAENIGYDLTGGPCADTAMGEMTFFPEGLQGLFPDDPDLVDMEAESYCGFPLANTAGEIIGHLAIMDDRPMDINLCDVPALKIFVARAAAEMERKQTEAARNENELRLKTLISSAPIVVSSVNAEGVLDFFDGRALGSLGFGPGDVVGQNFFALWRDRPNVVDAMRQCLGGVVPSPTTIEVKGRMLEMRYSPVGNDAGRTAGAIAVCLDVTEQRHAEKSLRESEERIRLIANNLPAFVSYMDAKRRYRFVNRKYEEVFGAKQENIVGRYVWEVLGRENYLAIRHHIEKALGGKLVEYQTPIELPGKGKRILNAKYVPDVASDGEVRGNFVMVTDVTDRIREEEHRDRTRIALSNAMPGISRLNADGRYVEVNDAYAAMLGYQPEELWGRSWAPTIHPEDQPHVVEAYQRMLTEGQGEAEARGLRKDGSVFFKRVLMVRDDESDGGGHYCFMRDISEQKQAESDRLEAISRYESIARNVPDCVWSIVVNEDGSYDVQYASSGWKRIWGYEVEELYQNPRLWMEAIIGEDRPVAERTFGEACRTGEPRTATYRIRTKDGELRWIEDRMASVIRDEDRVVTIEGIARDVTVSKQLEEQGQRHRNELAHVARLNTMGEMTTALAHELNQPLAAVANYAYAAEQTIGLMDPGAPNAQMLALTISKLKGQAVRAGDIVRRMRSFVQKVGPECSACDLNGLIQIVIELVAPESRLGRVQFHLRLDAGIPNVIVDGVQVQQVFVNLIRNAMDAIQESDSDSREITISTSMPTEGIVEVSVEDTGCGLGELRSDELFEPFYSTKGEGLGMGLAISRSIVEAHNGRLWAERTRQSGAEFRFTLPAQATGGIADA